VKRARQTAPSANWVDEKGGITKKQAFEVGKRSDGPWGCTFYTESVLDMCQDKMKRERRGAGETQLK